MTPRIFTHREAEATLPLVRRVVGDLLQAYPEWKALVGRYEFLAGPAREGEGEGDELRLVRAAVTAEAERIQGFLNELESIGCLFKGFEAGLVDFYALRDDRLVFLCWKYGETGITHWHEVDAGADGRQPVDDLLLTETATG